MSKSGEDIYHHPPPLPGISAPGLHKFQSLELGLCKASHIFIVIIRLFCNFFSAQLNRQQKNNFDTADGDEDGPPKKRRTTNSVS